MEFYYYVSILFSCMFILITVLTYFVQTNFYSIENKIGELIKYFNGLIINKIEFVLEKITGEKTDLENKFGVKFLGIEKNIFSLKSSCTDLYSRYSELKKNFESFGEKNKITVEKNKNIERNISEINKSHQLILSSNQEILSFYQFNKSREEKIDLLFSRPDYSSELFNSLDEKISRMNLTLSYLEEKILNLESKNLILEHSNSELKQTVNQLTLSVDQLTQSVGQLTELNTKLSSRIELIEENKISVDQRIYELEQNYRNPEPNTVENTKTGCEKLLESVTKSVSELDVKFEAKNKKIHDKLNNLDLRTLHIEKKNRELKKYQEVDFDLLYQIGLNKKKYLIKQINDLIIFEKQLIQQYWAIYNLFSQQNPTFPFPLPDGFDTFSIRFDGIILLKQNTLHLLSHNYTESKKLIEIVFCKYFHDQIDIHSNYDFYVTPFSVKIGTLKCPDFIKKIKHYVSYYTLNVFLFLNVFQINLLILFHNHNFYSNI